MYNLPLNIDLETKSVLKIAIKANQELATLKGYTRLLPNPIIILNAIALGEAKESSRIENIVTTYDEIYKEMTLEVFYSKNAKEVLNYRSAILKGYDLVKKNEFISANMLIDIHSQIEDSKIGIRRTMGTVIRNDLNGEIIHTPPQIEKEIREYLSELENYINDFDDEVDPLIKMAVIHLQFEMIHPFYDGNGRIGRILNVLYLILTNKIDIPIIYLSKYIIENKDRYYQLLKKANESYEGIYKFIEYILNGIKEVSKFTIKLIEDLMSSMNEMESIIKKEAPEIYSKELIEILYFEFYTKNKYLVELLGIHRNTASKYLNKLEKIGIISSEKIGNEKIYKNELLYKLINEKW